MSKITFDTRIGVPCPPDVSKWAVKRAFELASIRTDIDVAVEETENYVTGFLSVQSREEKETYMETFVAVLRSFERSEVVTAGEKLEEFTFAQRLRRGLMNVGIDFLLFLNGVSIPEESTQRAFVRDLGEAIHDSQD